MLRPRLFASLGIAACLALTSRGAAADAPSARACIEAATEGQKLRDTGKLLDARSKFLVCTQDACPADIRSDCAAWLSRVDKGMPRVVFGARDAVGRDLVDVRVLANDSVVATELLGREQLLDPGPYRFVFEREDGARVAVSAVLRVGDAARPIIAQFPAASAVEDKPKGQPAKAATPSSTSSRTIALIGTGAGALIAAGTFASFLFHAQSQWDDLKSSCAPSCTGGDVRALRTDIAIANVSGIAALALSAVFGGLVLFTRSSSTTAASRRSEAFQTSPSPRPSPLLDLPRIVWK